MPAGTLALLDLTPDTDDLIAEALQGLTAERKTLPCKLLYDRRGSELFDAITELPEYYPARTELAILARRGDDIAQRIGPRAHVIELGGGSLNKTEALLDALDRPVAYSPVDISGSALVPAARALARQYRALEVLPVVADYTQPFDLPEPTADAARRVIYFPGSTIGNFEDDHAAQFLDRCADLAGPGGGMVVGVDLRKDPSVLIPAYDDAAGVTAAFNLNLLHRLNREAPADFNPDRFHHEARWNDDASRIEMHLVSDADQTVTVAGQRIRFRRGETIHTECSYKRTRAAFAALAERFAVRDVWTDDRGWFSVQWLEVA